MDLSQFESLALLALFAILEFLEFLFAICVFFSLRLCAPIAAGRAKRLAQNVSNQPLTRKLQLGKNVWRTFGNSTTMQS